MGKRDFSLCRIDEINGVQRKLPTKPCIM